MVAFSTDAEFPVSVEPTDRGVRVVVDGVACELPRSAAAALRTALGEAIEERRAFFRTVGQHRADGSYVVARRGSESTGNRQVFASFAALRRLFERLPETFDAETVGAAGQGITGSRRHLLVRHFAEHPAFDCDVESQRPLRVVKRASADG